MSTPDEKPSIVSAVPSGIGGGSVAASTVGAEDNSAVSGTRNTAGGAWQLRMSFPFFDPNQAEEKKPAERELPAQVTEEPDAASAAAAPVEEVAHQPRGRNQSIKVWDDPKYVKSRTASIRATGFQPKLLIDIETRKSFLLTSQRFLSPDRFQELTADGALAVDKGAIPDLAREDDAFFSGHQGTLEERIRKGDVHDVTQAISEVEGLGSIWRGFVKTFVVASLDAINALRLSRQLQLFLPFQTGYESYLLGELINACDNVAKAGAKASSAKAEFKYVLNIAMKNRNVSRIIVQSLGPRWDFFFHWSQALAKPRQYNAFGQIPIIGFTSFPASENFPSTRNHAVASILRIALGEGSWVARLVTGGREGLVTDDKTALSQNLAAESNGFELANRNQYGTHVGRRKTNDFRFHHRLPTDESIVRTFIGSPFSPMINNGAVHQIGQLANHWESLIGNPFGNFAHQRMEQLDPFETMRFHMPAVLVVLSQLKGRNWWDFTVLAPFVEKCQNLVPSSSCEAVRTLIVQCKEEIVLNVCGGIAPLVDVFQRWLSAMLVGCDQIEEEATSVFEIVSSVELGIKLGIDLVTQVNWKIPAPDVLKNAIMDHIRGKSTTKGAVNKYRIQSALNLLTPRDKRTFIELVRNKMGDSEPAQLLLGRAKTLLQRELGREALNVTIRELSIGEATDFKQMEHDEWFWLKKGDEWMGVFIYDAKVTKKAEYHFHHANSGNALVISDEDLSSIKPYIYVPVAEAISRAQRAHMIIELDHGKRYAYNAFMEFSFLRVPLRRLVVLSQIVCEELDMARLNVLKEIQRSNRVQVSIHDLEVGQQYFTYNAKLKTYEPFMCKKQYGPSDPEWDSLARTKIVKCPPQSMIVIGGGPTGLMTTIHCTETVLKTGGVMKLFEARDAFVKAGSTFERAQIVRLDSRWIAMMRYHLGTGFEDVYIPSSGETDAQLGNTLPDQGFVEITIKDLECMLHVEVSKLWSKGLIQCHSESKSNYNVHSNTLTKLGKHLKLDDSILRKIDENGQKTTEDHSWKVVEISYTHALSAADLQAMHLGSEYGIYVPLEKKILPFTFTAFNINTKTYTFSPVKEGPPDIVADAQNLPTIYPKGVSAHNNVSGLIVESVVKGAKNAYLREELDMKEIQNERFTLDIGHTHVVECAGKPHGYDVHLLTVTYEPYGVCCIQGLKVSMGMHNFGNSRWRGFGLLDDIRSHTDQNTRIIGDFTKMVRQPPICARMYELMTTDRNWKLHFPKLCEDNGFGDLKENITFKVTAAAKDLAARAPDFRRQTLQTRFFETGDNYYLGMEFTREYDAWKISLASELVSPLLVKEDMLDDKTKTKINKFKGALQHHIDRLWYDACLETIRHGDVYNPGARHRVPRLYTIDSYTDQDLGELPVGEAFRVCADTKPRYEVVAVKGSQVICRDVEGYISTMSKRTKVRRESNLTRTPDGNAESKVSLATFPVGLVVNYRTMRVNDDAKGYTFAFAGDEQASPHFMRYSGLTGACINTMLFNNFIKKCLDDKPFQQRFGEYSAETNWSNNEVITRGTGANYGEDGFVRPGFSYKMAYDYLHNKVIEYRESGQDLNAVLYREWLKKFAASMVPRGMENNQDYLESLDEHQKAGVFEKFIAEVKADKKLGNIEGVLRGRYEAMAKDRVTMEHNQFWDMFLEGLELEETEKAIVADPHVFIARHLDLINGQIVDMAKELALYNLRISSELFNQPKPVDSIVDDLAVEAQNFGIGFVQSGALSSAALAFSLIGGTAGRIVAAIVGALNIIVSFGTMTNVSRYRIRNEEARTIFFDEKMQGTLKAAFALMDPYTRATYHGNDNPFIEHLEKQVYIFLDSAKYYDYDEPKEFNEAYANLKKDINSPEAIRSFQKLLTTKFMCDTYHVNSYLQEYLVNIYRTCEDMHQLFTQDINRASGGQEAKNFYDRLKNFRPKLEASLQRGPVQLGFLRKRPFLESNFVVAFRYILGLLCVSSKSGSIPLAPMSTEAFGIVKQARELSEHHQYMVLRRELRDLETMYYAYREADVAALMFVAGLGVFLASWLFTIARLIDIRDNSSSVLDIAFWAQLPSALGGTIGAYFLFRKLLIVCGLFSALGSAGGSMSTAEAREHVGKVKSVALTHAILTIIFLLSGLCAGAGLAWAIEVEYNREEDAMGNTINEDTIDDIPQWLGVGALGGAVLGMFWFFFIVEYSVRYNLDPKLGEYICESFRSEIEQMHEVLSLPDNKIDTKIKQEKETWEYVAREFLHKYRFDSMLDADRFGMILQYIQGGMQRRENVKVEA